MNIKKTIKLNDEVLRDLEEDIAGITNLVKVIKAKEIDIIIEPQYMNKYDITTDNAVMIIKGGEDKSVILANGLFYKSDETESFIAVADTSDIKNINTFDDIKYFIDNHPIDYDFFDKIEEIEDKFDFQNLYDINEYALNKYGNIKIFYLQYYDLDNPKDIKRLKELQKEIEEALEKANAKDKIELAKGKEFELNNGKTVVYLGDDYFGRPVFQRTDRDRTYVLVDNKLYSVTDVGEPDTPLKQEFQLKIFNTHKYNFNEGVFEKKENKTKTKNNVIKP